MQAKSCTAFMRIVHIDKTTDLGCLYLQFTNLHLGEELVPFFFTAKKKEYKFFIDYIYM